MPAPAAAPDAALIDGAARIFRDLADPRAIGAAKDESWRAPLWEALERAGVTRVWLPEAAGGAGASMADGLAILRRAGAFALSAPLAETLIAGWLLVRAGLEVPDGPMAVAAAPGARLEDGVLRGSARAAPFAAAAGHLAAVPEGGGIALVARGDCAVSDGANPAGEPRNDIGFDGVRPVAAAAGAVSARDAEIVGAAARAAQMTGALEAVLAMTVEYARDRVAFGRPIARFQVIQHELAKLASETAAAVAASGAAAAALAAAGIDGPLDDRTFMDVASAKVRVGEAAGAGAAIAHQTHGAIGFTEEHVLQRYTRLLWSWRDDFGGESHWAAALGETVAAAGADAFWPMLARP